MNAIDRLAELHDLDLVIEEALAPLAPRRLARIGLDVGGLPALARARARLAEAADRRGRPAYERARGRYGRGMAAVRERACQGCFIRLPTSAVSAPDSIQLCESCGRVLYWR